MAIAMTLPGAGELAQGKAMKGIRNKADADAILKQSDDIKNAIADAKMIAKYPDAYHRKARSLH